MTPEGFGNAGWINYVSAAYVVAALFLGSYAAFALRSFTLARKAWDDEGFGSEAERE